jgi:DNA-directed RNA polymerase specialized sigma24 family protein
MPRKKSDPVDEACRSWAVLRRHALAIPLPPPNAPIEIDHEAAGAVSRCFERLRPEFASVLEVDFMANGSPAEKAAALGIAPRTYFQRLGCARAAVETFVNDLALRRAGLT